MTYGDFGLELFHVGDELVGQLFDLLVVADVTQSQLVRVLHLELVNSRLQLEYHRVLCQPKPTIMIIIIIMYLYISP